MDIKRGVVVRSGAGRDKNGFFVVLDVNKDNVIICDGKRRSLEHPKCKNMKHLFMTSSKLEEDLMQSNRAIRKALSPFNNKV